MLEDELAADPSEDFSLSFEAGSDDAPGLPAAPLEDVSLDEELAAVDGLVLGGLAALDGLLDELELVDGLVVVPAVLGGLLDELELLDGLVVVPAVEGLVEGLVELLEELVLLDGLVVDPAVEPGVPGLVVESAVDPGLLTSVLRVSSRPASQPASASTMADAMMLFVQIVMIVFLCLNSPKRADARRYRPQTLCQCRDEPDHEITARFGQSRLHPATARMR